MTRFAYAIVTLQSAQLFIDERKLGASAAVHFAEQGVDLCPLPGFSIDKVEEWFVCSILWLSNECVVQKSRSSTHFIVATCMGYCFCMF